MTNYTYSKVTAANFNTSPATVARSATGSVYAITDTTYTTPLNITLVIGGTVVTAISSDANGYFPDFTLLDRTSCVWKQSGVAFATVLTTTDPVPGAQGVPGTPGVKGDKGDRGDLATWQTATFYPLNQVIANPSGDLVKVTTAHTSGGAYDGMKFDYANNGAVDNTVANKINTPGSATQVALSATYAARRAQKILVVGTSIAAGVGASSAANAYPAQIAAAILSMSGATVEVIAAGVSGDNSQQMLARLPALLTTHQPSIVVLEGSINDSRTDVVRTVDQAAMDMQTMVMLVRLSGAIPVITTSQMWNPFWYNNASYGTGAYLKSEQMNARRRTMAADQGVLLVDIYRALKGGISYISDGLHPNNTGHSRWGWVIAERILTQNPINKYTVKTTDTFNRADNASLGAPWTNLSGTHGVVSNAAQGTGTYAAAVQSVGANAVLEATFRIASNGIGLVARASDGNNYIAVEYFTATTTFNVYTRIGGTFSTKSTFVEAMADGDTLTLVVDGALLAQGAHVLLLHNEHPVCGFEETGLVPTSPNVGLWSANTYVADAFTATQ